MRSWTPRRLSPALEQQLFDAAGGSRAGVSSGPRRLLRWGWLAPVACVLVLALQLATPDSDNRSSSGSRTNIASLSLGLSNLTLLAYAPAWANNSMNNVNGETFKSTNWTTAPSSMRNLPVIPTMTNGLFQ